MKMATELYTDGSSLRNPGPSGLAYLIRYWVPGFTDDVPEPRQIEASESYRLSTNNRMEVMAVISGVNDAISRIEKKEFDTNQLNVFTDSEYVSKAVNQNWLSKWQSNNWMTSGFNKPSGPVKNKDLWEQIVDIQNKLRDMGIHFTVTHVAGHSDNEFNNHCDELAVSAAKSGDSGKIDTVYENTLNNKKTSWG